MKLLVFAHTPPPHHGQSFMVQKMIEAFGGDQRRHANRAQNPHGIRCYHVNSRVSKHLEEIGEFRLGKFILMLGYCIQALYCRVRYGVKNFYYVPAPGKSSALYRDWLVMALCRPFFNNIIFHWHGSGLGKWLETVGQTWRLSITYRLLGKVNLSIVLSKYGCADAEKLYPLRLAVVGNGIEDPCPRFRTDILPMRKARLAARQHLLKNQPVSPQEREACNGDPGTVRILFLSHCSRDKGLFESVNGVLLANRQLDSIHSPIRMHLTVAGSFLREADRKAFEALLAGKEAAGVVRYAGFVRGEEKSKLLHDSDVFCFPSYLESFGLVLAEAMACGMPIVATKSGALPEVAPPDCPCLVRVGSTEEVSQALQKAMTLDVFEQHRERFESLFTLDKYAEALAKAIQSVETTPANAFLDWDYPPEHLKMARLAATSRPRP